MQEVEIYLKREERYFDKEGKVTSSVLMFDVYRGDSYVGTVEMDTWGCLSFDLTVSLSIPLLKQIIPRLEKYLVGKGE